MSRSGAGSGKGVAATKVLSSPSASVVASRAVQAQLSEKLLQRGGASDNGAVVSIGLGSINAPNASHSHVVSGFSSNLGRVTPESKTSCCSRTASSNDSKDSCCDSSLPMTVVGFLAREAAAVVVGVAVPEFVSQVPGGQVVMDGLGSLPSMTNQWVNSSFGKPMVARVMGPGAKVVSSDLFQNPAGNFLGNVSLSAACQWAVSLLVEPLNQALLNSYGLTGESRELTAKLQGTALAYASGKILQSIVVRSLRCCGIFSRNNQAIALDRLQKANAHAVSVGAHKDGAGEFNSQSTPEDVVHDKMKNRRRRHGRR